MDDNYFDKKLKGILESSPDFTPEESDLRDMKQRLQSIQKPNRRRIFLPLLLAFMLLSLLGAGGFFYKMYDELRKEVEILHHQLSRNNARDTIINNYTIHQIDTIYTTIYRERYEYPNKKTPINTSALPLFYNSRFFSPKQIKESNLDLNRSMGPDGFSLLDKVPDSGIFYSSYLAIKSNLDDNASKAKLSFLSEIDSRKLFIDISDLPDPEMDLVEVDSEFFNRKVHPAANFIPKGFSIGGHYTPFVFPDHPFGGSAYMTGINGTIRFRQNRSLQIGLSLLNMNFESKDTSEFSIFPILDPTNPTDILHELKGDFYYLQIPILLKQVIFERNKFKPYFSAGFTAYRPIRQNLKYEYIDNSGEYKIGNNLKNGSFSINNFIAGIGTEYSLYNHVYATADLQYQHGFSLPSEEFFKLRYWALNLGIHYEFK